MNNIAEVIDRPRLPKSPTFERTAPMILPLGPMLEYPKA